MEIKNRLYIDLEPDQKLFFTSDLHFGHGNAIRFCNRPFADEKDMTQKLIENWNSVVTNKDIVISLGDFCWWNSNYELRKILSKLNGKKIYMVPGNHDTDSEYRLLPNNVELLGSTVQVWVKGLIKDRTNVPTEIFLCHYPMLTYPHKDLGVIQLFGHIHSGPKRNPSDVDQNLPISKDRQYDVGADNNEYTPVEIRDILKKLGRTLN